MGLRRTGSFALLFATLLGGCEDRALTPLELGEPTAAGNAVPLPGIPAARPLERLGGGTGSTMVLARFEGRKLALVADEDARAVRVIDATSREQVSFTALGHKPSQIVVAADGRAYVALRDASRVVALEMTGDALVRHADVAVSAEPVGLAVSDDGAMLLVTSAWGGRLEAFAVTTRQEMFEVALAREPRGVVATADGRYAYVSHAMGSHLSRVALDGSHQVEEVELGGFDFRALVRFIGCHFGMRESSIGFRGDGDVDWVPERRELVQGFAVTEVDGSIAAPMVIVHRGEAQTGGYGTSEAFPPHETTVATVARDGTVTLRVAHVDFAPERGRYGGTGIDRSCLLPRAIATAGSSILVGCLGTDEVRAYGATGPLAKTMTGRWRVPSGPVGIAVDEETGTALVWSQFARAVTSVRLASAEDVEVARSVDTTTVLPAIDPGETALSATAQRGRRLFHASGDPRISADGRACASCHPDGRDDGLTWPTPVGQRQTPMLAGRLAADTAPYGWHGDAPTVRDHLKQTLVRLGGRGLSEEDVVALLTYLEEMDTPPESAAADDETVARGRAIFESDGVGCAACHRNGGGSDGARHSVQSGAELETPSLRFVAGTAPYFHDGRYQTLGELLRETQGKMGWGQLGEDDLRAVEAYLLTL
jgi:mono/diheme cytochrome c family protein